MIRDFAKKVNCKIPDALKDLVVGVIIGHSGKAVDEVIPMYASGYAVLINIFEDKPSLIIDGKKQEIKSRLIIAGQICDKIIFFQINGIFGQLGIVLHPTAPYYLFHKSGVAFLNTWSSLEENTPFNTRDFSNNLQTAHSRDGRIQIMFNFLIELEKHRIPKIHWLDESLELILKSNGRISQRELIIKSAVSARHYRRIFKKVIGVSPKYYCKIIQLATVFELLKNSEKQKLHHLALDCGYYDQSHFIRDFQKLIGRSPGDFMNGKFSYLSTYMGRRGI
ncbi:AraC family transcriptional regulator [Antarcticibacterium flavum]|uniref:AraC family transcriptional regulator n=1 Tax=Antarcticibacterium flavum TaxID=2058175 RepID=A0A5B7WZG2_9FLAO|nr:MULTISPECIES: helix-turn-helix domain-containing protein [Antarcticibacterium]MCM4161220.1 hypothetical protein [Antarcticibacterium sp. W02-3]QCY68460.1 AraC family transcriptional regulator [Antarcticibacterium flavum]